MTEPCETPEFQHSAEFTIAVTVVVAGFNSIRSSHNPISSAMLHACDEVGMLVMDRRSTCGPREGQLRLLTRLP